MTARRIPFPLAVIEGQHLAVLIDQLTAVIAAADEAVDPAVERLAPTPYPQDAESAAQFATATRDDLLDRRTADAAIVRDALAPFIDDPAARSELEEFDLRIHERDIDAWLRTLSALRLVLATRLNIVDDDAHDPEDPHYGVYDWLGYRLDGLVAVADAIDEIRDVDEDATEP